MITSAPDALSLHEAAITDMWGRAMKGTVAANYLRHLLTKDSGASGLADADADKEPQKKNARRSPTTLQH
jgi:hypothetical protein